MKEKGSALYQLFLLGLSVYVLVILTVDTLFIDDSEIRRVLQYIDLFICTVFLGDFFMNLYLAERKLAYLKWGWIDLLSSIPAVDPLRWGRLSRIIRIIHFLRAIKSIRVLLLAIQKSKLQSLSLIIAFSTFLVFSLCSSLILEFEREYESTISTASDALWWSFLNILNAKVSINQAISPGGIVMTIILNKVGILLFAFLNAVIIAWLIEKRSLAKAGEVVSQRVDLPESKAD